MQHLIDCQILKCYIICRWTRVCTYLILRYKDLTLAIRGRQATLISHASNKSNCCGLR